MKKLCKITITKKQFNEIELADKNKCELNSEWSFQNSKYYIKV